MIFFHQGFYRGKFPNFDKRSDQCNDAWIQKTFQGRGGVHLQTRVGPDSRDFFFLRGGGGSGIEGVRTPSPKPWFVHGNYTEDFQNERKNALERHIAR